MHSRKNLQEKTLDSCHEKIMKDLNYNETIKIPELLNNKKELKIKYNTDRKLSLDEKLQIKDKISEINREIHVLKKERDDYLLNNSKFVHSYFEEKQNISEGNNNVTMLDDFFNVTKTNNKNVDEKEKSIAKKYFKSVSNVITDIGDYIENKDVCRVCKNGELIPLLNEGLLVCNNCSNQTANLIDTEKPSYKEPPKEVCFYAYKRINHFREIIAQFQAKETTQISDEIIEKIRAQIHKERIELHKLTNKHAKEILKRLNLNKYYEHIPFIKDKLGIKPPVMTPELENTLCNLFIDIQVPYAKFCPEGRVNFLNYYYTIYKLCELLDEREFLPYFPMLKDRDKRVEQDEIWKQICEELNWEFIPTL
jgi:hypothetical protein